MQKYFTQRQEIQIPQERPHVNLNVNNFDEEIEKLSKNYTIHRKEEVKEFIKIHPELIPYINKITPIINCYFPNYKKCITFFEDYEFEELNDISIYINSTEKTFEKDCKIFDELLTTILKMNEIPTEIKRLVSMDLWSI